MKKYLFTGLLVIAGALRAEEPTEQEIAAHKKNVLSVAAYMLTKHNALKTKFTAEQLNALNKYAIDGGKEIKAPLENVIKGMENTVLIEAIRKDKNYLAAENFIFKVTHQKKTNLDFLKEQLNMANNKFIDGYFTSLIAGTDVDTTTLETVAGAINTITQSVEPAAPKA